MQVVYDILYQLMKEYFSYVAIFVLAREIAHQITSKCACS